MTRIIIHRSIIGFVIILIGVLYSCQEKQLPIIAISKEDKISWTTKTACSITYFENNRSIQLPGKIKLRGGSSSRYDKHSFTIELDNAYSLGELPEDDDWILNANYIDKTFMRHKVSYDIFREMSPHNIASKSTYVNVSLNDNYEGLYVLMEKMNKGLIGLNKNDSMAMLFKDPPLFTMDSTTHIEDSSNFYQQKYPKIGKVDRTSYLDQFKEFLFYASNDEFYASIGKWIDIENIMDWHLILLFSNNGDGLLKNFYLYKIDSDTPFRIAIWDYDHSYGRDGDNEMNLIKPIDCTRAILLKRLLQSKNYTDQLKQRYAALRSSGCFSIENFEKHIEENHKLIQKELNNNFKKWPVNAKWYYDENNYEQEIDILRQFIRMRIEQLDQYFNTL